MDERRPSDLTARIVVRCGDELRDRLNASAKASGRSANTEAIVALEAWLAREEPGAVSPEHVLPRAIEDRLAVLVTKAMDNALSNPDLLRRFRQLEYAKLLRTDDVVLEDEAGRQFKPDDRLSEAGEVEHGIGIYPPLVQGRHVPREEYQEHARLSWERSMEERVAAMEKDKADTD